MKYNIKCSQCSKDKFVNMPLTIHYGEGYLCLKGYLCLNCGHIELFSNKLNDDLAEIKRIEIQFFELCKKLQ
ncbi:MAG: hypothetical protein K2N23_00495, partial [Clostridia bacterium]|nr:hypothetical protein [Clostridia bacterium]